MLLKHIKLAGFKSFVDPTIVAVPSNMVGIIGPNGCGKSNVIDAVRWVMGESSAKNLRGESMADVIFNGSTQREPVNQASVELLFDNSNGSAGGEYAAYAEISVRREVTRDGQSTYFLNGGRCRRKDIAAIFLGTGLGPRSYSIIQQGMVSRLVEAKPEELRVFLEEAAGISKYKERRRETSNRIKHTRENLERLQDVRLELEKQLAHLKRQANAAERYKVLKQEQRQTKAQLHAMRWQELDAEISGYQQKLQGFETQLEAKVAELRRIEADIESAREQHIDATEAFNEVQGRFYGVGGEIARVEQSIQHQKERKQQLSLDFEQAQSHWQELQQSVNQDQRQVSELETDIGAMTPESEQARERAEASHEAQLEAEQTMHAWQDEWDGFNQQAAQATTDADVEKTRIQHIEQQLQVIASRVSRVELEASQINTDGLHQEVAQLTQQAEHTEAAFEETKERHENLAADAQAMREQAAQLTQAIDQQKRRLQENVGKRSSLEALQEAALGQKDKAATTWLENRNFNKNKRLAQLINVDSGWEKAVETVLGDYLQSVSISEPLKQFADDLSKFDGDKLTLVATVAQSAAKPNSLLSKVSCDYALPHLAGVYTADTLEQALSMQGELADHESVITADGIWLGSQWIRVSKDKDHQAGVLERERELTALIAEIEQLETSLADNQQQLTDLQAQQQHYEAQQQEARQQQQQLADELAQCRAEVRVKQGRLQQFEQRLAKLQTEQQELKDDKQAQEASLVQARDAWQQAMEQMNQHADQRERLQSQRETIMTALEGARERARQDKEHSHAIEVKLQASQTQRLSLTQNLERMTKQFESLAERKSRLEDAMNQSDTPLEELEESRQSLLESRVEVESELTAAREKVSELDQSLRRLEQSRHDADDDIQQVRQNLESHRLEVQSYTVRKQTVDEQLEEMGLSVAKVLEEMEEVISADQLEEQLSHLQRRIDRLGPINLAAIDEFQEKQERKEYLDAQNDDLEAALATLEDAITKIDKETRAKFKETYDTVNNSFKELFPKVFGGGSAYLELTGNDLLDTGVTVMARPPGKRNSTIHLLSGGEKAMTAVALVFSIFQLNPAPFCMLDEVDAPLDDANVERFSDLVKEMSAKVQFIVITHNKLTMERANQLMGVTMNEPGVSRLVSVDVDEAAAMVEA